MSPPIPLPVSASRASTLDPILNPCFTCGHLNLHPRKWLPHPDDPDRRRTLVLCFDGTGASFDQDNSNVVQFLAMLKKDDPEKQLVYYQAGIGTYTGKNVLPTTFLQRSSKLLDEMLAWGIPERIKEGYLFLMQNYHAGDKICIFGFSRGAFTARALAGMLQKVGLLPPCNIEQLPFAYDMYARDDDQGRDLSMQFKRTFSANVKIHFLGVWDTVQSVGLIPRHFPFSGTNNAIKYFRHALALDEHRVKFIPFFYSRPVNGQSPNDDVHQRTERKMHSWTALEYEYRQNSITGPDTDVEEVFFAGAHCDVGGGSVRNGERNSLARIPLRWMIRECFKNNSDIIFDAHMLKNEVGLDANDVDSIIKAPDPLPAETYHLDPRDSEQENRTALPRIAASFSSGVNFPFRWARGKLEALRPNGSPHASTSKSQTLPYQGEAQEELNDALHPIHDELDVCWYWKIMEWIPWVIKRQWAELADSDELRGYGLVWNRGKGRIVYDSVMERRMKVHRSVRVRMSAKSAENKRYLPKIRCMIEGRPRLLTRDEWTAREPTYFDWVD